MRKSLTTLRQRFKENKQVFISKESSQFYMKILGTLHAKSENI